jgi:sugar phosphate isomerase/epimerase
MGYSLAIAAESLTPWLGTTEVLDTAVALRVSRVQLDASLFPGRISFSDNEAIELRAALERRGLCGESLSTFPVNMSPERYSVFLRRVAQYAPLLGLGLINTYLYSFAAAGTPPQQAISAYARALEPVLRRAAELDFLVTLEPESFDVSGTVEGLLKIVGTIDHPCFRLTFDPCNLYQANEEAFPYAYEALRPHIGHVHLKNGSVFVERSHPSDERAFPFAPPHQDRIMRWGPFREGALNLSGLLLCLRRDGYQGEVVLEPHCHDQHKQMRFLQEGIAMVREAETSEEC